MREQRFDGGSAAGGGSPAGGDTPAAEGNPAGPGGAGRPGGGWPLLAAFVERADGRLVMTFALSDVLPADRVDTVVLGVDALRDDAARRVTLYAVFEPRSVNVFSRCGDLGRRHDEAEISYPGTAVCVALGLDAAGLGDGGPGRAGLCLESQPDARGFAVIDGVTRQDHAPVTLLAI
ncbi:hypothetical protein NVV95_14090 [Herbiconiux sp. CPCC 205716]|uniref:Uncharacterized protein n=1 Tax=Herbiconiux gentiana TaxID=2970912 RepID=A0ABT2GHI1_9MICO|nr:hypothetical protein [Herbiconiux gentiana]MCS5715677.1 hypothetical protein [Herbiconiux gentiana]